MSAPKSEASQARLVQAITAAMEGLQVPVAVVAARTVREQLASSMLGMSVGAIRAARMEKRWTEGKQWHRAEDGTIWIDIDGVERWVRGES